MKVVLRDHHEGLDGVPVYHVEDRAVELASPRADHRPPEPRSHLEGPRALPLRASFGTATLTFSAMSRELLSVDAYAPHESWARARRDLPRPSRSGQLLLSSECAPDDNGVVPIPDGELVVEQVAVDALRLVVGPGRVVESWLVGRCLAVEVDAGGELVAIVLTGVGNVGQFAA